jgi:Immunity protein Imm1
MIVQFTGHIETKYYERDELVTNGRTETQEVIDRLFADQEPGWWTSAYLRLLGADTTVFVVVDPTTKNASLGWHIDYQTLNPTPFADDAPLLCKDGDDPLNYWMRNSYISRTDAEQAIWQYLNTGEQPTFVQWQEWGYEVRRMPDWLPQDPELAHHYHLIKD